MISNKEKKEECVSYLAEILPDYQKRRRIALNNLLAIQERIVANVNGDDINSKSGMRKYFEEFANNSSIHGFNHLVARHRHPMERFLAGMFILGGFACFIYVSIVSWYRYQYDGFITLLDQQQELIRLVKPSVIICPKEVIDESKFPATLKRYDIEDTPKNRAFFHYLSNFSNEILMYPPDYHPPARSELWLRILYDLKKEFYYETSLPGKGTWFTNGSGICFSIGNHITYYASIEYLLANNWTVGALPMYPPDVTDFLTENREIDDPNYVPSYVYYPNQNITEFFRLDIEASVEICDPMDLFAVKGPLHFTQNFQQLYSTIEVQLFHTIQGSDSALTDKNRRKCRFPLDKGLKMWPIYTKQLCAVEYRAQLLKRECGCYLYFYPHMPDAPLCNISQFSCISKMRQLLMRSSKIPRPDVNCFKNCHFVYFFQRENVELENAVPRNYTNIEIKIIFPQYKYSMKERFSFTDFMISVGSAAGFFLGCSVLSAVEIFYYTTVHFYITTSSATPTTLGITYLEDHSFPRNVHFSIINGHNVAKKDLSMTANPQ